MINSPESIQRMASRIHADAEAIRQREREVAEDIAKGLSDEEVIRKHGVGSKTIKWIKERVK